MTKSIITIANELKELKKDLCHIDGKLSGNRHNIFHAELERRLEEFKQLTEIWRGVVDE